MVTGAAGYIGGQTMLTLKDRGYSVIGVDTRTLPPHIKNIPDRFFQEDFSNDYVLHLLDQHRPQAIIHCAGTSLVGPSIQNPELYFRNNFVKTKRLVDSMIKNRLATRFIFSSSAAVYGEPTVAPCCEDSPVMPVSAYGQSKLMTEMMLDAYRRAYNLDVISFRYFNACGADAHIRHGQESGASHILARVLESMRDGRSFTLYGDQYATPDGTCVRDYVHVSDIADAHILAIDATVPSGTYNLGTNQSHSNREIIELARKITNCGLEVVIGTSRSGDPAKLTASADLFRGVSAWVPRYQIEDMLQHAWSWYTK